MKTPIRFTACLLALTAAAQAGETVRPVRVQTVTFAPRQEALTYSGTVQARVQANLGFRVAGKVTERLADIGQHVAAGQVLARLDPSDANLAVESDVQAVRAAEAQAVNARADFQRYQRMGSGSAAFVASEFDRRKAALDSAEAKLIQAQRQLALARDQLGYTVLTADAAGVVTTLNLEVGQVVTAGQTVLTLAHTAETEIAVDVPENRLDDIRNATGVAISLWSRPDRTLPGKVREIGALADSASRTFSVKVTIAAPAADQSIGLGMTASVRFARTGGEPVALLPASAVVSVNNTHAVWTLDAARGRAEPHQVRVAAWLSDGQAAIAEGIAPGAQVITAGAAMLDATTPVAAWAGAVR